MVIRKIKNVGRRIGQGIVRGFKYTKADDWSQRIRLKWVRFRNRKNTRFVNLAPVEVNHWARVIIQRAKIQTNDSSFLGILTCLTTIIKTQQMEIILGKRLINSNINDQLRITTQGALEKKYLERQKEIFDLEQIAGGERTQKILDTLNKMILDE